MHFIDYVGITGGILFLFGFYRVSIGKWTGKSMWYEIDNLLGAILMGWYTFEKGAFVNIFLNLVWGIVALNGVTSLAERRMKRDFKKFAKMNKKRRRRLTNQLNSFRGTDQGVR